MLAPINVDNTCSRLNCCFLHVVNDTCRIGGSSIVNYRFLEEIRSIERRVVWLRMEIEKRLETPATGIQEQ